MIEEQIKKANIQAMKDKDADARAFYSIVLNRILLDKIAKGQRDQLLPDADVVAILQKLIKEMTEEKENYAKVGNEQEVALINKRIAIASTYLPQMLTEEEVKQIIDELEDKSIGAVMKHFKTNYTGKVDMRLVQEVLKK
ncbi:MAG: GatB/YqeY domain-containing protein [Clostridia bacterium]|nr:GatB/YqeY domain-containing protein [Clostridia bacterium]